MAALVPPPSGPNFITSYTPNEDKTIIVPTGSQIKAQYSFNSPYFTCNTVGSECLGIMQSAISPNTICSKTSAADPNGKILLYVSQLEVESWWEASGGLVYGNEKIKSLLPVNSSSGDALLCGDDPKCDPFLVRSANFTDNLMAGLPISKIITTPANGWMSERSQGTAPPKTNQYATDGGTALEKIKDGVDHIGNSFYDYYKNLAESKTTILNIPAPNSSTLPGVSGFHQLGVDGATNTHKFTPSSTQTVTSGKSLVLFVNGNLEISGNSAATPIKVDSGGFLAFIVKGTITIDKDVGTAMSTASMPTVDMGVGLSPPANLAGMYISDGNIVIQNDSAIPDKRFVGEGSFISMSGFDLPRKYARNGNINSYFLAGFTPTELFRHRPDMVLSTPPELKENLIRYQEIN
jgi:hypothetical protein